MTTTTASPVIFNPVEMRFEAYGHDVAISDMFDSIIVDGRQWKLKQYSGFAYKILQTQLQCQTAEHLYKFILDPFWQSDVEKVLDRLSGKTGAEVRS